MQFPCSKALLFDEETIGMQIKLCEFLLTKYFVNMKNFCSKFLTYAL